MGVRCCLAGPWLYPCVPPGLEAITFEWMNDERTPKAQGSGQIRGITAVLKNWFSIRVVVDNKTEKLEIVPLTSKLGRGAFNVMSREIAVVVSMCLGSILWNRCFKFILEEILNLGKTKCTSLLRMKMTRKLSYVSLLGSTGCTLLRLKDLFLMKMQ